MDSIPNTLRMFYNKLTSNKNKLCPKNYFDTIYKLLRYGPVVCPGKQIQGKVAGFITIVIKKTKRLLIKIQRMEQQLHFTFFQRSIFFSLLLLFLQLKMGRPRKCRRKPVRFSKLVTHCCCRDRTWTFSFRGS